MVGLLPCLQCRGGQHDAGALRGVRLGAVERNLLLTSPPPDGDAIVIEPERLDGGRETLAVTHAEEHLARVAAELRAAEETCRRTALELDATRGWQWLVEHHADARIADDRLCAAKAAEADAHRKVQRAQRDARRNRSLEEAQRRALKKLARQGLVSLWDREVRVEARDKRLSRPFFRDGEWWEYTKQTRSMHVWRTGRRRTPLGQAVVELVGAELEAGRPIRWTAGLLGQLARAARSPRTDCVRLFGAKVEARGANLFTILRLGARFGNFAPEDAAVVDELLAVAKALEVEHA